MALRGTCHGFWKNLGEFLPFADEKVKGGENKKSTCGLQVLFLVERMRIELTTS